MNTPELLSYLHDLGIKLWSDGQRLRLNAPAGVLTPILREQVSARKAEILSFIERAGRTAAMPSAVPPLTALPPESRGGALPLSFAQQRLWFVDQLQPGSPAYNVAAAFRLHGNLFPRMLAATLTEIVRRHEVRRTTCPAAGGEPLQVIAPPCPVSLPVIDLGGLAPASIEIEISRLISEEVRRPFDLSRGPLLRVRLLRLGESDHAFAINMHHIVSDGWSIGVLTRELVELYRAFRAGRPSPLPELPVQYADFSCWQRQWLQGEALKREVRYWREQLTGAPPVLALPADRPRPSVPSSRGAVRPIHLPEPLSAGLANLAVEARSTLFMALLAAFQVLLGRYSSQDDVSVGTPIAGRNRVETEGLIGFFVNTLVIRSDLAEDPAFRDLLGRVREVMLEAHRHQDLPFERLVEDLRPERSLSHSPLFQVVFLLQNAFLERLELADLSLSPLPADTGIVKFDLVLTLGESPGGLRGTLQYSTDLFDAATIDRMVGHFETLLEGIARAPEARLSLLPLLTPAEQREILGEWSCPGLDNRREACLHELFAEQVERTPERVAARFEGRDLTYRELDAWSSRLAHRLRRRGVGPEALVGVCLERSLEMVAGVLGVLKAGGAFVPLDPAYPKPHLASILEEARPMVVLSQPAWVGALPPEAGEVLLLDAELPAPGEGAGFEESWAEPRNLAYAIYTSGSTGRPKGVMIPHGAICNHLLSRQARHPLRPGDSLLQQAPFSFEMSLWEIFWPLIAGARLVLATPGGQRDPDYLAWAIAEEGITALRFTPSMLRVFLETEGIEGCRELMHVFTGAESLPVELMERFRARLPGRLHHLYGPTETCVAASLFVGEVEPFHTKLPIGRSLAGAGLYLLGPRLEPVPVGVPGELYIGGRGVARGYLARPDLTAERFVPHPFGDRPGERLYRTGDLVRWLPDGNLDFLGRVDHQVKVRGFRVELNGIEVALSQHPAVREAAVVAHGGGPGDSGLIAYVAADSGTPSSELRSSLRDRLPEYMIPAAFVRLEKLPRTRNGKVDRGALPAPDLAQAEEGEALAAPRTPAEEVVAAIWGQVLRREVGIHDNFFDLGGHSLLATQVVSRVRQAFGVELPLRSLFETPTVSGLARTLDASAAEAPSAPPLVPVPRDPRGTALPLSFAQQRLWFLDQLQPGSAVYNIPAALRLRGDLSVPALAGALGGIVRRHEVLRTTFRATGTEPFQWISPEAVATLAVIDLSALPEPGGEAHRLMREEARQPFDLARGPLVRSRLLSLGPEEHVVLVTMHHIVSDGWSTGVLVRELRALYRALRKGEPSPLPELAVQYADFASWQRSWLQGAVLEAEIACWRDQLRGVPPVLTLPIDRPRPAVRSQRGASLPLELSAELSADLVSLARRESATPFMILLAGLQVLLGRHSGQDDVSVGTPVAGRNRVETEGLIGFFVNTLVMRGDLSGAPGFRELLSRTREVTLQAYRHQDVPFEKLVEELRPERSLSYTPLFQVMFALQNVPREALEIEGLELAPVRVEPGIAKFDLLLALSETGDGLVGGLEYSTDLFDTATMQRLLGHFRELLRGIAREPERKVSELPLLSGAELEQVLRDWNSAPAMPASEALHRRFEAQAARTPDAVALVFGERRMTYAELDAGANRIAHHLRRLGAGAGTFVGVCLERSCELVTGILGTLKAGAAYVPLDPAYPSERWKHILQDSGIRVLLTQEKLLPLLPEPRWEVVCVDRDRPRIEACPAQAPPAASASDDLFYRIYTSGSTGRPKGVATLQRAVLNLFDWYVDAFELDAGDSFLLIGSIGFDMTQKTVFVPLLLGGRLIIPPPGPFDPAAHLESIERHGITRLNCTPSTFYPLIDQAEDFPRLASLRGLSLGGEPISLARLEPWRTSPWCRASILNTYGPTECTDLTTWHRLEPPGERDVVPIGRPLPGVQVWVLSRELEPVPVGVTGHLCASGNVTPGYLGHPAMTAEKFLPNPFSGIPGDRLYQVGDLARWLPAGELEYLGRADFQIKLRGFRIEPGEIEAALAQHPAVHGAVVLARGEESRRLVAWLAVGSGPAPGPEELRDFLKALLPEYMIPAVFVPMEALPQTPNGKIDRHALPEPDATRPELGAGYVAPRTPEEEALAEVWAEVLAVDRVGVHDNFFALGGDSIRSVRVLSLAKARGLRFALPQLFQHQTIAQLVPNRLEEPAPATKASGPLSLLTAAERAALPEDIEDAYPVSALQLGMLFHSGFGESATALYQIVSTVRLSRALDTAALQAAAAKLAERHPMLRASFDLAGFSRPLQLVHRAVEVPVTAEDLGGLKPEEREAAVARRFEEEKARRFALDRPPLLRFHVQHLGGGETQLFWALHHAILDGWSLAVLLSELFQLFNAELEGTSLPPAPASTFREFIALEREVLESDEARDFWVERLRGAEPARLLPWHPEEEDKDRTSVNVPLPEAVLAGLRDLGAAAGVPLKNVFLAAHVWVVGRITGTRDVITGLVTNGRPEAADADRILGLFLNTVPLHTALPGGTWMDLVRQTFEAEREVLPFRRYPLPEIQRELGTAQLFETSFNYINFYVLAEARQASGLQLDSSRSFGETSIPLAVDFVQDSVLGTARLNAQRDPARVNQTQLRSVVDLYLRVLSAMAEAPTARYDAADLLSPAERQQVLQEWNDTALVSHLESDLAHEVFERWAALTPDAPALLTSSVRLSYRALNRRANRIARRLRAGGAGPEVAVGLYVERSPEMIAGLLGILKAGAAYVPLDPAYPRDRLLMMIEDVHMPLVLTQERLAEGVMGLVPEVIAIDRLGEAGPEDDADPKAGAVGDNLAYAIFTSGSTGRPKPVGVSHRALTWHMAGTRQVLHMAEHENDTVLQFSTLNFDGSVDQVFIALVNGDCLALREEEMWSAEELEERIARMGLTIIDLPTGYWSEWVRARSSAPARQDDLRVVYVGGEAMLSEELAVWWRSPRNRDVRLLNAYGPTETVVAASFLEATRRESAGPLFERVAIGHPLRGRALHVVDPDGRLSPVGVSGELLIAGEPILARGYLGRPDLTAERFLPDPFSPLPGARLYRTGDLGRYLPDGRREFLGRVDDQVKVRGFRIELGEVEAALSEHPAVHRAAAVVHGKGRSRLVAYVTFGDRQQTPTAEELRAFLRGKLPEPMVPSDVVFLDRLPLTPNGKVDRRALPAPELSARRSAGPAQAPRTDVELQLAAIWEELLDVSPIGVTDDFLELGGHSLLAVRLMARIEHVFGVKLPISALFEAPTVERLASVIQRREAPARSSPLVRLHPGGEGRPLFVVHPVGGDVFAYVELARKLGADRPVYGLQAVAEDNGHPPAMEELAARYLAAVREVQAEGPWLLAGWSLGAVIAYEMAQQIESSGGSVALLAMIDPSSPADGRREGIDDTSLLAGFAADLVRLSGRPVAFGQEVLEGLDLDAGLDRLVELGRGEGVLPPDVDQPRLRERFDLFGRHVKALQGYVPRPYGGRVSLFRASATLAPGAADPTSGWAALAGASSRLFDADHYSLLQRPALDLLVEHLRSDLAAALRE